ncbi:MAG TPA: polysaccharide deacetylase family protein [Panacibacter sp.]|nr:polysaccharide deacetylase family protein [Panacibacter sp.]HNP45047.1 polysaccharide deacetylase family protein [Panacibacter sp.]
MRKFNGKMPVQAAVMLAVGVLLFSACGGGESKDNKADSVKPAASTKPVPGAAVPYDSSKLYIYLTWDDAPQPPGTMDCKRIFESEGVKATFFVVGMNQFGREREKIVDTLRNSYPQFLMANHSTSHGFRNNYKKFYSMPDSAVQDFMDNEVKMKVPVKIIRLPGNNSWVLKGEVKGPKSTMPVCHKLDSLGYNVIGWDIEWQFKGGNVPVQSADQMIAEVNKKFENYYSNVENNIVILAHDRMFEKPQYQDSLRKVIATLKQNPKVVFETIDHYPTIKH